MQCKQKARIDFYVSVFKKLKMALEKTFLILYNKGNPVYFCIPENIERYSKKVYYNG